MTTTPFTYGPIQIDSGEYEVGVHKQVTRLTQHGRAWQMGKKKRKAAKGLRLTRMSKESQNQAYMRENIAGLQSAYCCRAKVLGTGRQLQWATANFPKGVQRRPEYPFPLSPPELVFGNVRYFAPSQLL